MKHMNRILAIAAFVVTFGLAGSAIAQNSVGYRAGGDDGIAASPKLRQHLNEHKHVASTPSATIASVESQTTRDDGIAASPKLRQQLNERKTVSRMTSATMTAAGYRATGDDGIAASPKLRQHLNERSKTFIVAPVK